MNDRYLFRGKTDTGKWLQGDLIHYAERFVIRAVGDYWVIPETVGQYIGKNDKNDKFIFEGDILSGAWKTLLLVYYDEASTSFLVKDSKGHSSPIDYYDNNKLEVVGNIYDNPELMKGGVQ